MRLLKLLIYCRSVSNPPFWITHNASPLIRRIYYYKKRRRRISDGETKIKTKAEKENRNYYINGRKNAKTNKEENSENSIKKLLHNFPLIMCSVCVCVCVLYEWKSKPKAEQAPGMLALIIYINCYHYIFL